MSLLKKLLGKDPDEERARADALFEQEQYGQAKLAYERAARGLRKTQPELARELSARADACCDAIARARIEEAERLYAAGSTDLAIDEWEAAIETAADTAIVEEVEARLAELHADDDVDDAAPADAPGEPDADMRFEMLTVTFEDARVEEYQALGVRMRDALLALHEERAKEAREELEALLEQADEPRYLHFEVARARLLTDDPQRARESLEAFLATLGPAEGGDARLAAHVELARAASEADDFEGAIAQYEAAIDAQPEDPRPYVLMAGFFRAQGLPDEAIDVLGSATAVLGGLHPQVVLETGLAHADAGRTDEARSAFERAASLTPPDDPLQERIAAARAKL